ncbi:aminopeptidase P family protein [Acrocarpospora macrocephala]|uniref:Dipeptidase n=1 Tax=Acrocarpospora macrocephala TaxID=150177 RepID=A0A5M3WR95_9ACTN|nr:Xaa-Pro peptidase family protein [Acrocarpospora macrocephala]GES11835.1 dipeptidase [Acrocarpospora macrocephala]
MTVPMDHPGRRARFSEALTAAGIDLAFCPPSGDLEYLTGFPRRMASFGNNEYANQWVAGALFRPGAEPVYVIPQGYAAFNLPGGIDGEVVAVANTDDAATVFAGLLRKHGPPRTVAVSARTFGATAVRILETLPEVRLVDLDTVLNPLRRVKSAEELHALERASLICDTVMAEITPRVAVGVTELEIAAEIDYLMRKHGGRTSSFDTGVFAMGPGDGRDASTRVSANALVPGLGVSFDFGTVVDGYCSDFGRTVHLGEPGEEYRRVYDIVIAAQAAGMAAALPGATAADVHRATRQVIVDAGYGDRFRHRTGHCIGLDTHERPFISEEDHTVLEEGMTFTIEPSIFWPGHVGARVEDLFVCTPTGAHSLNRYHREMVVV